MTDLLSLMRENDLPPKWDGRAVLWESWRDDSDMFVCPPPHERSVCPACGSVERRVRNRGLLAHRRSTTAETIANYVKVGMPGKVAYWSLFAYRCTDCKHDQVWDMRRDELWDLDPSDYADDGSEHPDGRW
jgi:hypothetical protein